MAGMYFTPASSDALLIEAQAQQFAYYYRYPGPDGRLGPTHPDKIDDASQNYFGLDQAVIRIPRTTSLVQYSLYQ